MGMDGWMDGLWGMDMYILSQEKEKTRLPHDAAEAVIREKKEERNQPP